MEQNQALNVLVTAVNLAQKRGAYNLQEAAAISAAISVFTEPASVPEPEVTEKDNND